MHLKEPVMTQITEAPLPATTEPETLAKVAIVVSHGSLEGVYPGLIMANGARMEGIEADLFFTFFGLDAIRPQRQDALKVATVGNPGMHVPTLLGALPGMSAFATRSMKRRMEKLDIPPVGEFVELLADSGAGLYACKASVDMFGLTEADFVPQVAGIITVGEFYGLAAGGQIVFT
jgi:peroxiredoxin family protein